MKTEREFLDELVVRHPRVKNLIPAIEAAIDAMYQSYLNGGTMLFCGNGGSAADSEHIVGELMKGFVLPRPITSDLKHKLEDLFPSDSEYLSKYLQRGMPAISLVSQTALSTAFSNDNAPDLVFAQQVLGYGKKGDIFFGITTSGNSKNVVYAAEVAKALGLTVIGLTGESGGKMKDISDILINVPEKETFKVQELHLPIYHIICLCLENRIFGE
jgi:D-sedoheptulose 7-phosphate isomerase